MEEQKPCPNPNCACDGPCTCGNTCTCVKPKEGAAVGCDNEYCKVRDPSEIHVVLHAFHIKMITLSFYGILLLIYTYSVLRVDAAKGVFVMFQALRTSKLQNVEDSLMTTTKQSFMR